LDNFQYYCWKLWLKSKGDIKLKIDIKNILNVWVRAFGGKQLYFQIKKEALWLLSNATSKGYPEDIKYLVDYGLLNLLIENMSNQDIKILQICLDGLTNILKCGD